MTTTASDQENAPNGGNLGLQAFASLGIAPRGCVYFSTPITTGPAFVKWKQGLEHPVQSSDREYWDSHRTHVIEENLRRVTPVVEAIRRRLVDPLIDPTPVSVAGWTQRDYHTFWTEMIRRWCHSVILSEGWEFSTGCCFEAATAYREGLTVLDESLIEARRSLIKKKVVKARREMTKGGFATPEYETASSALLQVLGSL